MKFAIQINEGPYQHQASDSAYMFTKAALEKGHEVFRVFFYHDGVNNGTRLTTPPQDDRNIVQRFALPQRLAFPICPPETTDPFDPPGSGSSLDLDRGNHSSA